MHICCDSLTEYQDLEMHVDEEEEELSRTQPQVDATAEGPGVALEDNSYVASNDSTRQTSRPSSHPYALQASRTPIRQDRRPLPARGGVRASPRQNQEQDLRQAMFDVQNSLNTSFERLNRTVEEGLGSISNALLQLADAIKYAASKH